MTTVPSVSNCRATAAENVGVPRPGGYREVLNTDAKIYGGSNIGNAGLVVTTEVPMHGRPQSLKLTIPPLAAIVLHAQ